MLKKNVTRLLRNSIAVNEAALAHIIASGQKICDGVSIHQQNGWSQIP